MDNNYPENADPRPKRRKSKDNPDELITVGINTDHPRFFVRFTDGTGVTYCQEVSKKVFDDMDEAELDDLSVLNENDRHREQAELSEYTLHRRAAVPTEPTYEAAEQSLRSEALHKAISYLPPIQRRRVLLHYFAGFTLEQIGDIEGCSKQAVKDNLRTAEKNLAGILKKFL